MLLLVLPLIPLLTIWYEAVRGEKEIRKIFEGKE